jgi:hypothetical protein
VWEDGGGDTASYPITGTDRIRGWAHLVLRECVIGIAIQPTLSRLC